ncbi:nuclear transport factor 2 family protein [Mycobacterium sp. ITM-2016-00317]|uniref:nuclear transport factor 2 family protein n=1 Tax=Mycobacterium sp. ITM-2016-00317 TaxID=2099694 RepID=UPI00287F9FFB|nr:nuclear transport factor 2 family protein [Mycobacterium sp. ITM-2016-00317]WNG86208.1 nuclear transport factor 2 family protein [Mycobacterium sp. ITM-2016-00317]
MTRRRLPGMQTSTDYSHILRGMYAAEREYLAAGGPGHADFAMLAPYFAEDVVLCQATALPYGGVWRGHDGMREFFAAMAATWDEFEMLDQQFLATAETAVVRTRVRARARATHRELSFPILQTLHVVDGRIAEVWPFYWDTAAIVAAIYDQRP